MKPFSALVALALLLSLSVAARPAFAWGERAQQTIAMMAAQVLKDDYKEIFRPGDKNFEKDILRGTIAGHKELKDFVPLNTDAEAIQAVSTEIQLLRDVQKFGSSSYFAFRLGVLSSLVADLVLPYGFAWDPQDAAIQARINADIEKHLENFNYMMSPRQRTYVRDAQEYFRQHRAFFAGDKRLIADDYARGAGYQGFLKEGGPAYFGRAIEAVADVWHTVLSPQASKFVSPASQRQLTWYFVKEIEYLLNVKDNFHQALKAYEHLESLNSDVTLAFETVGNLFYDFGRARNTQEAVDRGVREWQKAYQMGGPERSRISEKLSNHYLTEGQFYLSRAATDQAEDTDLPTALAAFEEALQFNRTSKQAADLIEKTHTAIAERRERLQTAISLIAQAEQVREAAGKARLAGDYSGAIGNYNLALTVYEAVDDEFKDQKEAADNGIRDATRSISEVMEEVTNNASEAIEQGDKAQEQNRYDEAQSLYQRVEQILAVIPEDAKANHLKSKEDLLKLAAQKIDEAKQAKLRYEAAQKAQQSAGGAKPAAGAPAATGGAAGPALGGLAPLNIGRPGK